MSRFKPSTSVAMVFQRSLPMSVFRPVPAVLGTAEMQMWTANLPICSGVPAPTSKFSSYLLVFLCSPYGGLPFGEHAPQGTVATPMEGAR